MAEPFDPRRTEPGARITYHDRLEGEVTLHADDEGVIWPKTDTEVRILDEQGLPVARKALAEKKAESTKEPQP